MPADEAWELRHDAASARVYFSPRGFVTETNSKEPARRLVALIGRHTVDLVVDLDGVTGYTSEARRLWQEAFVPVRSRIRRMLFIGSNVSAMLRMGATVVAAFNGIPVRFFSSYADLDAREPARRSGAQR